jgi:hypothetical protein
MVDAGSVTIAYYLKIAFKPKRPLPFPVRPQQLHRVLERKDKLVGDAAVHIGV